MILRDLTVDLGAAGAGELSNAVAEYAESREALAVANDQGHGPADVVDGERTDRAAGAPTTGGIACD